MRQYSRWLDRVIYNRPRIPATVYLLLKRSMDLVVGVALLAISLPVMAVCAFAIKLEDPDAPVIFGQQRTGKDGKPIRIYKFRTMVENASEMKAQLMHLNELEWPDFKISNDPRLTRVGRFLRAWSLDELPQFFNVVRGDLSLVGPRPTSFGPETYELWQTARLDAKPGLTGLWQVAGRASLPFPERVRLEIAYIEHRSLTLDLALLTATVPAVIRRKGAR